MKVRVRVHPGARVVKCEERADALHVWVKAPPVDGRANEDVAEALARHFRVPPSTVQLVSGATSRSKLFELPELS